MPGAPIPIGGLRRRVETLERELADMRRRIALRDKPARLAPQWNLYLAKTVAVSSYPSPPGNVFGIQFLTPTFTRTEGEQTPTYDEHSAAAYDVALSLIGWIPEDTYVFVHRARNGQYVITSAANSTWYIGKVVDAAISSEACGTVEQHKYDSGAWVATGVEFDVYNPHDIELPIGLKVRWSHYPGWTECGTCETDWIVEPWHWTEC